MNAWRVARWDGEGGLRNLMSLVLTQCLDEVLLPPGEASLLAARRSGFGFEPSDQGLRLLPMLNASECEPMVHQFAPTSQDVATYGTQSGDLNPLHFDAAFARELGFDGPLIHGMMFNGWLTRYLGMEWPGAGTLFKRSDTLYLAPVYPDRRYSIRLSIPVADRDKGHYRVVAQLLDEAGAHCTVAYNDVVHRNAPAAFPLPSREQ